jgi:endonuclease YncB( thermonuclease family)
MQRNWTGGIILAVLSVATCLAPVFAADSIYGRITAVRSANVVVMSSGRSQYVVRIVGVDPPPAEQARGREARQFVTNLLLNKNARLRLERRAPNGELVARLFTDDPANGIKDVGLELLRAGLARRQGTYDGKYGEMAAAENEARTARRGIWATPPAPR